MSQTAGAGTVDLRKRRKRVAHRVAYNRDKLEIVRQWLNNEVNAKQVAESINLKGERTASAYTMIALTLKEAVARKDINFGKLLAFCGALRKENK